ncbi:MAG TPA: hypothetical protein V6D00_00265 [Pantanalinema sp.]
MKKWLAVIAVGVLLAPIQPAQAFAGDPVNGKKIFMTKGPTGKACMTCHPKGLTTNDTFRGKDIPDLTAEVFSERKIRSKTEKFLKYQKMTLNEKELSDLLAFVSELPTTGFGSVPAEWKGYVQSKVR